MDFEWVAIALGDVTWLFLAFVLGFVSRSVGLPPLVGFLCAGFLMNAQGIAGGDVLQKLSDLGITLLLFTVGLKLNLRTLIRPQVWAVTSLHTAFVTALFGTIFAVLALSNLALVTDLNLQTAWLVAFALSFSSTVFVAKTLEEKGEMSSLHGRIAIGVLIVQDLAAVVFLAVSAGKAPTIWALALLLLIPMRPLFTSFLKRVGHGELLVLYGFLLALGGAELFEMVGVKGDLGALALGVLIANHPKAEELAKTMLGFKDLFLLGFFLSIGISGELSVETLLLGALITPFIFIKSGLFFLLFGLFSLRARTSLLATLNLTNYSEFGLIVAAIGVANGWLANDWLIVIAVALSLSLIVASGLNVVAHTLYKNYQMVWTRFQKPERLADDDVFDMSGARVLVIGMGGLGTGAYDEMRRHYGDAVLGVDIDPLTVRNQQATGRQVLLGDPSDPDFWDRVQAAHTISLIMLTLPKPDAILEVLRELDEISFDGHIAATVKFPDEAEMLEQAGVSSVFNIYSEAGSGFADHVASDLKEQLVAHGKALET